MDNGKRWVAYIERDGKPEYLSYIDIMGNEGKRGLCIKLSHDVKDAIRYRAEFRAKDDCDLLSWKQYRSQIRQVAGDCPFKYRLLSPEEVDA